MKKRKFFYFTTRDFKGVQRYLEELAAQGWELMELDRFLTGRFEETRRTELSYYVDLVPCRESDEEKRDYLRLCEDAGWELVGVMNGMRIFKSMPCRHPVPVQTDGEIEAGRFRRYNRQRLVWGAVSLLLVLVLSFLPALAMYGPAWLAEGVAETVQDGWYQSWMVSVLLVSLPLLLAGFALRLIDLAAVTVWNRRRLRRTGRLPAIPRWLMGVHSCGSLAWLLFWVVLFLSVGLDGVGDGFDGLFRIGLMLLIWCGVLLYQALLLDEEKGYTPGQKKGMLKVAGGCVLCVIVLCLLAWLGPWHSYQTSDWTGDGAVNPSWQLEVREEPIVMGSDLGLTLDAYLTRYENGGSLFALWWSYEEHGWEDGFLTTLSYRCLSEGVARYVTGRLVEQTGAGLRLNDILAQPALELEEVAGTGLDACWYGVGEDERGVYSTLILRQGSRTALVSAPMELLNHLDTVRQELGL